MKSGHSLKDRCKIACVLERDTTQMKAQEVARSSGDSIEPA